MTPQSISGMGTAENELCRVSVIGGNTQLDVGLPATLPIAAFIGDLVALIASRSRNLSEREDGGAPLRTQRWTLARIGRDAIASNQTLTDAEVFDGDLLVLRAIGAKESPALFDDVIDAVARLTKEEFRDWSAAAAQWTGLIAAVIAVFAVLALAGVSRSYRDGLSAPFVLTGAAVAAMVAAMITARKYSVDRAATGLTLCGLLLVFGGAALFVPGPLGAPHALLGSVAMLVVAVAGYRLTGTGPDITAAIATLAVFAGASAAVKMIWDPAMPRIAAGVVVAAIPLISWIPRLAALMARLPVPPVPTAGGAIDPTDHEPRPTIEGIGAIGATVLPSAAGLGQRARFANQFQTGLLAGIAAAAAIGAVGAAAPLSSVRWPGIALAVVVALILCLRGRAFADLIQAGTLIAGGCLTFIALVVLLGLGDSDLQLIAVGLLLIFVTGAVGFGVIGPYVEVTPVTRRMNEIFEYALILSLIPLVLWIMEVYSMARNL
ncbi:type VII secretion integral membrane protein EccD [Nocardia sp. CA-107356]|uniref:type VII secretion integral membrane protein EccD n=1 Tax=Nocardia sp. CA-107356 TaxID=3239972 RepID=UPI003D91C5D7